MTSSKKKHGLTHTYLENYKTAKGKEGGKRGGEGERGGRCLCFDIGRAT